MLGRRLKAALSKGPVTGILGVTLYTSSALLLLNVGTQALLGFVFWVTVARLYPPQDVGFSAALVSMGNLLAGLAGLGLDSGLMRFLPERREEAAKLINAVLTIGALFALVAAGTFLVGIPLWSPAFRDVQANPLAVVGFIGLVVGAVVLTMVNAALLGSRRVSFVLAHNTLASVGRLGLTLGLASFLNLRWFGILLGWAIGLWVAITVAVLFLLPRTYRGYRVTPSLALTKVVPLARFSFFNYLTLLFFNAQLYLTPLIVVNRLGTEASAYYFSGAALASTAWAIPLVIALAFLLEEIHGKGRLALNLRRSGVVAAAMLVPLIIFLWFGGHLLLLAFGSKYSDHGLQVLRILALAAIPVVIADFYIAVQRVRKKMEEPALFMALVAGGGLAGAYFLAGPMGLTGVPVAILAANTAGAIWAIWRLWDSGQTESKAIPPASP